MSGFDLFIGFFKLVKIAGYIFVHAGLETEGRGYSQLTIAQQMEVLRTRTCLGRIEMLCGRDYVLATPGILIDAGLVVVSGVLRYSGMSLIVCVELFCQ